MPEINVVEELIAEAQRCRERAVYCGSMGDDAFRSAFDSRAERCVQRLEG